MKRHKNKILVVLFTGLIFIATSLFFVQPDLPPLTLQKKYTTPDTRVIEVFQQKIHYKDIGTGRPMVLIHGLGGSLADWNLWSNHLGTGFRVISLSLPGFGLTGPNPLNDYSLNYYNRFLDVFLKKLGVSSATIVGHSFGALIAASYSHHAPQNVRKIALLSPAGIQGSSRLPLQYILKAPFGRFFLQHVTPMFAVKLLVNLAFLPNRETMPADFLQRYYDLLHYRGNRIASTKVLEMMGHSYAGTFAKVPVPTLIIWGDQDRVIPVEYAKQVKKLIPNSKLIIYKGIGHMINFTAAYQAIKDVGEFSQKK